MTKECSTCHYCQWDSLRHRYVCENKESPFYGAGLDDWLDGICDNYKEPTNDDCAEQNGCISCSLDDGDDCCRKLYEESMQEPTTKSDSGVDYAINGLDDFIKFGKKAFGVELTIKKSDNPDTYEKLFGTTKNNLEVDCIDRKELIDWINTWGITPIIKKPLIRHIQGMVSVIPQEPKRGHWIETNGRYKCSVCYGKHIDSETRKWQEEFDYKYPFFPNCGAKMDREVEE